MNFYSCDETTIKPSLLSRYPHRDQKSIRPRISMLRAGAPGRSPLTTPTLPGVEMLEAGTEKFGWLKALAAAAVNVNFHRSVMFTDLASEMWCM
jgi:hypothetical protein